MPSRAVIFDLDGTILLNEQAYGAAFKSVLESLGAKVAVDHPHIAGLGIKENWPGLLEKYHIKTDKTIEILTQATQNQYLKHRAEITLADGVLPLLDELKASGWETALATSNAWWLVEEELKKFNLENKFTVVTTQEEIVNNKPAPDIFMETAAKLGVDAQDCIVIEDSAAGVKAAKAAGMKAIAITSDYQSQKDFQSAGADIIVTSMSDITPKLLSSL